jgi:riboflavin-specific deaminase-like protein
MHEVLRIYAVVSFSRIFPDRAPLSAVDAAAGFGPVDRAPPGRPYLGVNMVATADGKATIDGRSGPIGNEADRELFHELRAHVEAVLVGAGTVRTERYGPLVRDPGRRERRLARGLDPDPLAVIVSGRLDLPLDLPLLQAPEQRVVIVTAADHELPDVPAKVDYIRGAGDGSFVALAPAIHELRARFGVRSVLCEGGPLLNSELLRYELVDELWLTVAPKLAGGASTTIVSGAALDPPEDLALVWVLESGDDHLFLRYRVRG